MSEIHDKDLHETGLPIAWGCRSLGDIAEITMGNSPPGESYNEDGNGVPLVNGPVEFSEGAFGHTKKIKFTTAPTKMCKSDDFLICVRGSTTGRTNIAAFDACIGRGVASIRARQSQSYLNHFVRTLEKRIYASGKGSTFPSISQQQLAELSVPLPCPDDPVKSAQEQKRIADILDKADAIRRKRQDFSEEIFTLTDAIFQELVGDPVTNPMGWERMTYKEAPIEIFDGDRGKEYPSSGDFSDDGFCLFLSAKNVTKRGFNFDDKSFITKEKDCSMRKGKLQRHDVVITTRGTVGNVAYFGETVPFDHIRINSGMLILRAEPRTIMPRFLSLLLQSSMFQRQVEQMRSGSAQPQLPIRTLEHMYLLLPDVKTQTTCVERIDAATKCGGTFNKASTEAVLLFNSLVQRAFKGEL